MRVTHARRWMQPPHRAGLGSSKTAVIYVLDVPYLYVRDVLSVM